MIFTEQNSLTEFDKLNHCIQVSQHTGKITDDDAETLAFFLELIQEALTSRRFTNA